MLGEIAPMAQSTFRNIDISQKIASLLSEVCAGLLARKLESLAGTRLNVYDCLWRSKSRRRYRADFIGFYRGKSWKIKIKLC